MKGKVGCAILCFFSLYVIAQGIAINLQQVEKYYKCWIYAQCYSDGPAAREFEHCIEDNFTPQDLNHTYKTVIKPSGNLKSDTFNGEVKEMCYLDDKTRRETYTKEMEGFISYLQKICKEPEMQGRCSRLSGFVQCTGSLLSRLKKNDQCDLSGPIQNLVQVKF